MDIVSNVSPPSLAKRDNDLEPAAHEPIQRNAGSVEVQLITSDAPIPHRVQPSCVKQTTETPSASCHALDTKAAAANTQDDAEHHQESNSSTSHTTIDSPTSITTDKHLLDPNSSTEINADLPPTQPTGVRDTTPVSIPPIPPSSRPRSVHSAVAEQTPPGSVRESADSHESPESPGSATASPPQSRTASPSNGTVTETDGPPPPYTSFSRKMKWMIAVLAGVGGIFSPISSNIFVPSIPTMAKDFHRSNQDITLAITVYLIFQAFTPSIFGSFADSFGRRPAYIITLSVYIGANVGLAVMPTSEYWLLLFLRALQATGGSAVISIGAGTVSDIAEPRERGTFMAIFQTGAMLGPAIGPLLGGVFAQTLGWRSMFWFLVIFCSVVLVPIIFFFPETLRSIVGDGSIPPPNLNASPSQIMQKRREKKEYAKKGMERPRVQRPPHKKYKPLSSFLMLLHIEVFLLYFVASLLYLLFYCVISIFSTILEEKYALNDLQVGLCYLPSGIAVILSGIINGRALDYFYRREERRVGGSHLTKPDDFKIDVTRIRVMFPQAAVLLIGAVSMGWCLQARTSLAAVLVMSFIMGLGVGTTSTAVVWAQDINPGKGGAASASLNLMRCAFGAVGTAVIQLIYGRLGAGWMMVLLDGICLAALPILFVVIKHSHRWRTERKARNAAKAARRAEKKDRKERADEKHPQDQHDDVDADEDQLGGRSRVSEQSPV